MTVVVEAFEFARSRTGVFGIMSLKAELETWSAALTADDNNDFDQSIELFSEVADSSKILTNIGLIYATLGEHERAVEHFAQATELDQFLAIAYSQSDVSHFLLATISTTPLVSKRLPGEQLGLNFLLYSPEILF